MPLVVDIQEDGCWKTNYRGRKSDGRVVLGKPTRYLYREVYESLVGSPTGVLHHTCNHPWCVNPWHLADKTQSEHMMEHLDRPMFQKKEFCKRGHRISEVGRDTTGWCRQCKREKGLARYHANKGVS